MLNGSNCYKFIDIGSNLTDLMFQGVYNDKEQHKPDLDRIIERSINNGIKKIIITSGCYQECIRSLDICEKYDPNCNFLYTTVGVHPTRTKEFLCFKCKDFKNDDEIDLNCTECQISSELYLNNMKEFMLRNRKRVVAIGELGLDSDRTNYSSMKIQQKYFEFQFKLLIEFKLPLFLHIRGSHDCYLNFLEIINRNKELWRYKGGVAHSFTGNKQQLSMLLESGLDIGVNGCSLKSDENLNVVVDIPIKRLHIETDSPWCEIKKTHSSYSLIDSHFPQVSKPSKWSDNMLIKGRNEPIKIVQVAQVLYKLYKNKLGIDFDYSFDEFIDQIYNNTLKMYF